MVTAVHARAFDFLFNPRSKRTLFLVPLPLV
jgi:hypothetical protein